MIFSALSNVFIRSLSAICERKLSSHVFIQEGIQWMEFIDSHAVKSRGPVYSKTECIQGLNVGMHSDAVFLLLKGGFSLLGKMAPSANLGYSCTRIAVTRHYKQGSLK